MWWRKNKQSKPPAVYEGPRYRWMKRGFRFGTPVLLLVLWFWPHAPEPYAWPLCYLGAYPSIEVMDAQEEYQYAVFEYASWTQRSDGWKELFPQTKPQKPPFIGLNFGYRNIYQRPGLVVWQWKFILMWPGAVISTCITLVVCVITLVILRIEEKRNFKRYNFSYCPSCGYNISHTETDTCPECDTLIPWPPKDRYDRHRQIPHRTNRPPKTNA